ncbi:MAG: (Fe-S)-binding protein, partial [Actinobacteria bacterium]|nr:(Fe-S)-binding protein [Actinomycetota bacterium]
MPTRDIYWNIQGIWAMYALFAVAAAAFAYGVYQHYRLITIGKPEARFDRTGERLRGLATHAFVQARGLRDRYSGIGHLLFFWGFIFLFFGTVVVFLQADLGTPVMHGQFYLYFESLTLNVVGLLGIIGLSMAVLKRYALRPDRLINPPLHRSLMDDGVVLSLLLAILLTGFILQGLRIAATDDPWANWSPIGSAAASTLSGLGLSGEVLTTTHRMLWWFHMLLAFAFIAYIPYSKLRHLLLSPAAIYFRTLRPSGALQPIDMEKAETLGAAKFEDLTWKQLLDTVACTECGRCQDACPAYAAGQPLSPKALILDLRNALYRSKSRLSPTGTGNLSLLLSRRSGADEVEASTLTAAGAEAVWSCVTCGACMQQCPVFIEHVPTIVDLRRYMVMEQAEYPELMQEALGSMEARGHPFRGTTASRTDWCEGL